MKAGYKCGRLMRKHFRTFLIVLMLCISCGGPGPGPVDPPVKPPVGPDGLVSSVDTLCAEDLVIFGDWLYVADGPGGLKVVNITDLSAPSVVRTIQTTYAFRVYIYEGHLYLCDAPAGLKVYSLATPSNPVLTFSKDTEWATSLAFRDGYLYQGDYYAGLQVYNVSDPGSPVHIAEITKGRTRDTVFLGDLLLTSDAPFGLVPFRFESPTEIFVTFIDATRFSNFEDVVGYNGHAIIARNDERSDLSVYNLVDPENPSLAGTFFPARFISGLTNEGSILMAACGEDGVTGYDMTGLPGLAQVWKINTPGYARRAKLEGDYLYVADMSGVRIYDHTTLGGGS